MVDPLPDPRPEDDEDVVWGLSTAAALWARGERGDAVVWLRRAADAASTAGQEARAGELEARAAWLEREAAKPHRAIPPPPAPREPADTLPGDAFEPAPTPSERGASVDVEIDPEPAAAPPRRPITAAPPAAPAPPPERGPLPSKPAAGPVARTPILDPWGDQPAMPSVRADPALLPIQLEGDEVMVQMRRTPPRYVEDDDGIVTSAAPIEATLRRAAQRPPTSPPRRPPAASEQPLGQLAEPAAVPSKAGASLPWPAAPPAPPPSGGAVRVPTPPPAAPLASAPARPSARPPPPAPRAPGSAPPPPSASATPARRPISIPAPKPPALDLSTAPAFADVPADARQRLASLARVEMLFADDEVSAFGAALVIEGDAYVCATIVDAHAARAAPGELVPARGTLADAVALRVVAGPAGARVAVWDAAAIEDALRASPAVLERLVARADELQAFAGATMGPLGELDDDARGRLLGRFSVRVALPRDVILDAGALVPGVILVCAGAIDLPDGTAVRAGDVLFPGAALDGSKAHSVAWAAASGAVLLVADRGLSAELAAASPLAALLAR